MAVPAGGRPWWRRPTRASRPCTSGLRQGPSPCTRSGGRECFRTPRSISIGRAHIVYVHNPEAGSTTAEEGDVRYLTSARAPYGEWSEPVTVNDDGPGRAQGFASLAARRHGRTTVVEAVWEDTRLAPDLPPGPLQAQLYLYDIFHARLELGWDAAWFRERPRHGCVVDAVSDLRRRAGFCGRERQRCHLLGVDRPARGGLAVGRHERRLRQSHRHQVEGPTVRTTRKHPARSPGSVAVTDGPADLAWCTPPD